VNSGGQPQFVLRQHLNELFKKVGFHLQSQRL
jgi:hypothetical protein